MTAFWSTAVAKHPTAQPPPSDKIAKASNAKARPSTAPATAATSLATAIKAAFSRITTAATASSVPPPAAVQDTAATSKGVPQSSSSEPGSAISEVASSSLVAVQILNSLSYLQFCRMKLTVYNTLLKAVLTSVSTSPQVQDAGGFPPALLALPCTAQKHCWPEGSAALRWHHLVLRYLWHLACLSWTYAAISMSAGNTSGCCLIMLHTCAFAAVLQLPGCCLVAKGSYSRGQVSCCACA